MKRTWILKALATPILAFGLLGTLGTAQTAGTYNPNGTTNPNYAGRTDDYSGRTDGGFRWGWLGLLGLLGLLGARKSHTHDTTTRTYDRTETYEPRPTR